ncbi:MAG: hypothetical protein M3478_01360 [Planctomycetota bacterium]|nr:hypothetical protein [Planctomycetota bacterium]
MTLQADNPLEAFQWKTQPQAYAFIRSSADAFLSSCPPAADLAERMQRETGTRFDDWIDTIILPTSDSTRLAIESIGYEAEADQVYVHLGGVFPRIGLHGEPFTIIMLKVEYVADFAAVWGISSDAIDGEPMSVLRQAKVASTHDAELWVVERHGERGYVVPTGDPKLAMKIEKARELFRTRRRNFEADADDEGFAYASRLVDDAIAQVGADIACDLFFAAEREYWQRRNRAAQVQKARQDRLGLGWANHDHHTYRCSRENFAKLIAIQEKLGLVARERFYAGREAGWGAQVMEQPVTGIVTFNDVDLSPEELYQDFAHDPLPAREQLGTVGLWCALHGDSMLQAGMHHLEAQFDFEALRRQLQDEAAVKTMKPFTDFPHLRQAFTEGERWKVRPERIDRLLSRGLITLEQSQQFRENGALGSHLENLERNDGFKGFNQTGVSEIIAATDPRKHSAAQVR